ncbi:aspartate ammonia-lyase [Carnobacterium inhibens]|uniref:aspartate ammonia-lyase n=1 Tax=Carnobacterium inhibens TaxID=147709 RepID=UPI00203EA93F|nr:aspartate ammonia-lyase [Carnobacterium inhibens]MCM3513265.1 aspartate ammonia-lyase [Carnobacterium inhibens]
MIMHTRIEFDSIGSLPIPGEAYYGIQSLRAKNNFSISGEKLHPVFIKNLAIIKKIAAITNYQANNLSGTVTNAICEACNEIIAGEFQTEFIVDTIQGGAGTSANMNMNEVIAHRASEILGGTKEKYDLVHPNDHVNCSQSTNDVFPSAGKLTVLELMPQLISNLSYLENLLEQKAIEFSDVIKMGRTQLQDAVPTTLGHSFKAYQSVVHRDIKHLIAITDEMYTLNIGATAIGNGINASVEYSSTIAENLARELQLPLKQADNLYDATQNVDSFVRVSGVIKTAAISLSKMSNDLRLLSSGPKTGFGEINLPARQNGSSIMPGKVNPVIPEVVSQVAFQIVGNDVTITMAAESGQLELNPFEPIIFRNLFSSIELLTNAVMTLADNCIVGITVNEKHCRDQVEKSVGIVTALCPFIGYKKASEVAKEALKTGLSIRQILLKRNWLTKEKIDDILDLRKLAEGNVPSNDTAAGALTEIH